MWVEGGIFFKINKRDSTFIREMRVAVFSIGRNATWGYN